MKRAKSAGLVFCLFILYCVLLSQGLRATVLSTFFGALAAIPLTIRVYNLLFTRTGSRVGRTGPGVGALYTISDGEASGIENGGRRGESQE